MNFNEEYMSNEEAIKRILDHMKVHHMGEYPHLKIKIALDMAIEELKKSSKNKNKCENCVHKDVCALWEIQNELIENNCIYYLSNSILNNRGNNNAK